MLGTRLPSLPELVPESRMQCYESAQSLAVVDLSVGLGDSNEFMTHPSSAKNADSAASGANY